MIRRTIAAFALLFVLAAGRASALSVDVKDVRRTAMNVHATIQLRDVIPDRFKKIVDRGGQLHLRLQAELWESRPVWDRLVYPAMIRMFRMAHLPAASRDLTIDDSNGGSTSMAAIPNPWEVLLDLGSSDRITAAERYYVRVVATIGTLAERDADDVNDAVFGRPADDNTIGSFGRMLFRTAMRVGDYMQSVSAEVKSRKIPGTEINQP
jgi:hypothetical protein